MAEVEQMKNTAEKILESVPRQKEVVDKTTILLSELNPVYKEKKETEQRFSKIEESISRMESTVNNFINSFNNAKGNSNTDNIVTGKDRKSTRLNSSHSAKSRMPSSA